MDDLVARMRADLTMAMRARDRETTAVLRSTLGAVANAEAVPAADPGTGDGPIAGAATGVGAAEAARRELSSADIVAIVRAERDEQLAAAAQLDAADVDAAAKLRAAAADVLDRYL